jgi:hypothetical protein
MAPFEMRSDHRCRTPLVWDKTRGQMIFGHDIWQDAERQVSMVKENMRIAQSKQKNYTDRRRKELSFEVGDFIYLKVSPMRRFTTFQGMRQACT